jgi:hypothetical protein
MENASYGVKYAKRSKEEQKHEDQRRRLTARARRLGIVVNRYDSLLELKRKIKRAWK